MSNEESGFGANRRTPRQGIGGSPVGSWLTIGLAAVAVILGFLILRNVIDDDGTANDAGSSSTAGDEENDDAGVSSTNFTLPEEETTTTTTTISRVTDGASVVVANGNSVGGSAGDMTDQLAEAGYTVEDPVNAGGSQSSIETSAVFYEDAVAGAQDIAESVARDLGGLSVEIVETPAPTVNGDLGEAGVLLVLGDSEAGKTIDELSGAGTAAAPDPSGGDTSDSAPAGEAEGLEDDG